MRSLCALSAASGLAAAAQLVFSVQTDLLAYPQYTVEFSESYILSHDAHTRLALQRARDAGDERTATDIATHAPQSVSSSPLDTYEHMRLNGTAYLCTIPHVEPLLEDAAPTPESEEQHHQELERASVHGWELLQGMKENCLYYPGGWWWYSFCFDDGVKQFHPLNQGPGTPVYPPMEDPKVHSYVLGRYDASAKAPMGAFADEQKPLGQEAREDAGGELSTQLQTRGETNYLVQKLGGGTVCDLTNRERTVTVQFHCDPNMREHIHMIKETASCVYLMVVHTPRLCNDVAFRPPEVEQPNRITCQEIVEQQEVKAWTERKAQQASETLFQSSQEKQQDPKDKKPLVIGGIEVGGRKLVGGTPETRIETSNIVKPPPPREALDKYIATLAKSDGRYRSIMAEKEIHKLGLQGKPGDVEKFIETIEDEVDEGVPWRLDVYKTPGGYEFRAIIEEDDEYEDDPPEEMQGGFAGGSEEVLFEQGRVDKDKARAGQGRGAQETKEASKKKTDAREQVLRDEL